MLVGIISDTHDNIPNFKQALKTFKERSVGLIIHCGDWCSPFMLSTAKDAHCKIISVLGNNDGDIYRMMTLMQKNKLNIDLHKRIAELTIDNKNIAVYHGDDNALTTALIGLQKYHAVFTGHTHKTANEQINKTLHLNPGSASSAPLFSGAKQASVAIYNTATNTAKIITL